jgi:MarR family transcriptional regulator, 2-MHQ and catechol-resistance regulon repressor
MPTKYNGDRAEVRALNAYINLVRAAESVTAPLARRLSDAGLTISQFGALEALWHLGPLNPCELGRKLLKTGGNMTMVIDNLEKRGLVERARDPDDRRYWTIHLTGEGRKLIGTVFPDHAREIAARMSALTATELAELRALCRKLGRAQATEERRPETKRPRRSKP